MSKKTNIRTGDMDFRNIPYLKDEEVAQYIGCSLSTARKIGNESGAVIKVGKVRRVSREVLDSYLTAQLQNA